MLRTGKQFFEKKKSETSSSQQLRLLSKWARVTTVHGLRATEGEIRQGRILTATFWLLVMCTVIGLLSWQSYQLFDAYINGEHYETKVYYVDGVYSQFPNITICNLNKANLSRMQEIGMDLDAAAYFFSGLWFSYPIDINRPGVNGTQFEEAWKRFYKNISSTKLADPNRLLTTLGHSCQETMVMLRMGPKDVLIKNTNGTSEICDHFVAVKNVYGICYSLPGEYIQTMPGPTWGINAVLFPHTELYLPNFVNNIMQEGFAININFDPLHPFPINPYYVGAGTHTMMAMTKSLTRFKEPSINVFDWPCVKDGRLKILKTQYSRSTCIYDCFLVWSTKFCNCTLMSMEIHNNVTYPVCLPQQFYCSESLYNIFTSTNTTVRNKYKEFIDSYATCIQPNVCGSPCEEQYNVQVSTTTTKFPSSVSLPQLTKYIENKLDPAFLQQFTAVTVYYESLGVNVIEMAETQTVFDFVGSFGGQLGLWLGASIVTIIEALWFLLYCKKPGKLLQDDVDIPVAIVTKMEHKRIQTFQSACESG